MEKGNTDLGAEPFDLNLAGPGGSHEDVTLYTGARKDWKKWRIQRQGPNHTGYWVLRVPKEIIAGHGPIFEGKSLDLMAALFRVGNARAAAQRAVPVTVQASPEAGPVERTRQRIERQPGTGETLVTPAR